MFDIGRLNAVSDRLGEAALDPALWPLVMEDVCKAAGTLGAALLQSDVRTPDIPTTASVAEAFKSYFDHNLHLNDVRAHRGVPLLLAGAAVVTDQDLFGSERDMLRDPLYAHIGQFGLRWCAAVGFKSGSALWGLALQRTAREGPFEASETRALGRLSRRLTETATLSKAVGRLALVGTTNALQLVRQPALALDRLGFVIETNALANALFDEEFRIRNRRLCVQDQKARSALSRLLDVLRITPDTAALPVAPITAARETRRPIVIGVLPVDGAARSPFLGARAILTLTDLELKPRPDPEVLAQVLGITPSQARLAALIATGKPLEEVATELGIALETARNHLKSIFAKAGTHRQGELVALLSRL
jgi:DNA-binding CsgD family transcriptional regulator